ncbi:unnamed protein product [Effrenium voratum]|uniref:Uncharacterized protein n=1 Tax=Effrenium voratum TaxID=2562239 RepID=A0AA36ICL7_9DINO|nr:unnamed protein product [Effrenium voratum]
MVLRASQLPHGLITTTTATSSTATAAATATTATTTTTTSSSTATYHGEAPPRVRIRWEVGPSAPWHMAAVQAPRLRPKPELSFRPRALGGQSGPGFLHDARPLRVCLAALPLRGTWKERVRGWLPWRRARERQEKLLQLKEARQSGDEVKLREALQGTDGAKDAVVAQSFGQTKAVLRALLVEQELKSLSKVIDSGDETELRDAIQAAREVLPEGELQRAEEALCKLVQGRELKNLRSASTGDDVTQLRIAIKEARKADVPPEKVEQAQDALNEMILAQELKALTEAIKSGDELQLREAISDASKADVPVEEVERAQQFLQRITLRRKIDLLEKAIESKDEEQLREGISAAWKSNLPDDDAEVARATDVLGGAQAALKEIILGKELKQLQEAVATGEEDQLRAALSQARSVLSEEECAAAQEALNSLVLERKLKALRSAADSSDEEQLRAAIIEGRKENLPSAELDRAKVALDTLILAQNVQNLQEAVESEDEELLRKAILEAKQLELPEEEIQEAQAALGELLERKSLRQLELAVASADVTVLKEAIAFARRFGLDEAALTEAKDTLRQTTLDKASKYLQNSAECQEEEQLRDAISEARKLDLPQEELEAAQQVLNELIQERQTEELRRAVLRQEESELKDAIREARRQEVPQEEIDKAQDTLSRVVSERKLGWLDNAIEARDESELRTLLAELRKMEMSEGLRERREEALGAGQAVLAELALERELMNVARAEAISEQDLREAIDQAREANVPSSKLEPATETLQQLTVQRLRADVAQVELSDDEAEIRELLQEAKVLLAPEELEGARERLATLQLLRELSEASTRTALRALLLKAEQKGLEHLTVEVARRKLAAIEELREAEQSRDLPLIETLLAQAKRLRVDPDVISAAEGVLERELGIQRFGLKHGVVIFKRDGQHLPIPFQERFRSEDIFELMIGVYRSRTLQQVAVPVGICTAWAAICAVVATRYQLAEGAWRLNQFLVTPLGLLLTFRTQQSITRFNIAVDLWSKLSSVCRSLSRAMFYQAPEKIPCDAQLSLANDLQLFPEVLREHLENRRTKLLEICRDDVSKPMALLDKIQAQIMALKQLESSERTLLLKYVEQLSDLVSPCESIVQTPVPQSYVRHTGRFLAVWLLSLPLSLASQSGWLTVAIELVASWCLFAIQEIGVRLEDPFNGQVTMHIFIQTVRKEVRQKYILLVEELVKSLDSERMDLLCESWSHRFDDLFFQVLEDEQRLATDKTRRAALAAVAESVKQYL